MGWTRDVRCRPRGDKLRSTYIPAASWFSKEIVMDIKMYDVTNFLTGSRKFPRLLEGHIRKFNKQNPYFPSTLIVTEFFFIILILRICITSRTYHVYSKQHLNRYSTETEKVIRFTCHIFFRGEAILLTCRYYFHVSVNWNEFNICKHYYCRKWRKNWTRIG